MSNSSHPLFSADEIGFAMLRYEEYHKRLLQEYDLSWQQLKISMYISSILLLLYGTLISYQIKVAGIKYLMILVPIVGVFIAISSLIILMGSLVSAKSIRDCLGKIEQYFDKSDSFRETNRYLTVTEKDSVKLLGNAKADLITLGKVLLQSIVIVFWGFLFIVSLL